MKITVSQFAPPPGPPRPLVGAISHPGIAAVLDARVASLPRILDAAPLASPPLSGDDKVAGVAFEALGLAPKSAKLLPELLAIAPPEFQAGMRAGMVQLEKAAQEELGKPAFEAGMFVLGAPGQVARLVDGTLGATARLSAGGRFASEGLAAFGPFVPALAPSVPALCDVLMLATVPEDARRLFNGEEPALQRLTAGGRLVATGLSLAAHFVAVLAPYAPQFRSASWIFKAADKTLAAKVELPKPGGA